MTGRQFSIRNITRRNRVYFLWLLSLAGVTIAAYTEDEPAVDDGGESAVEAPADEPSPGQIKSRLSLRIRTEYEYRKSGDYTDNDLNTRVYAQGSDLYNGRLDLYASLRFYNDLDKPDTFSFADDPYTSVSDADGVDENRLMQLYADVHSRDKVAALRVGRQYVEIADFLHLDGAQILYNEKGALGGRVYYGQPVSYYTSVSGDEAGGISLIGRPWEGASLRATAGRYDDDSEDAADDHYFLDLRQQLTETMRARGQLSILNDEYRMGRLDTYYYSPDGVTDVSLGASYWGSFDARTRAYSPLYNALGEQDPYTYTYIRITRQIADHWYVSPGAAWRMLKDGDSTQNNRDYQKYDLALIYEPTRSLSASLSLEHWSVEDSDSFVGVSGDVRYRHGRDWEVSAGASYAEYNYDTYSDLSYSVSDGQVVFTDNGTVIEESPFVYTYFIRTKCKLGKHLTLRAQGDIEDDDTAEDLAYRFRGSVEVRF